MIKAVIFDCFGVLTNDTWREFLNTLPPGPAVTEARRLNHLYDAGKLGFRQFIDEVARLTSSDTKLLEKIFTNPDHNKNLLLLGYIKSLRPKYKVGLLSNVNRDWIRQVFLTTEEQKLFDNYTLSYEVGTTKPDPSMYQAALDKLAVKPEEAVFIDDVEAYCHAAQDYGLQAVHYKNFAQMKAELETILNAQSG